MDLNIILNGVLLPLMAVYFIPTEVKANGFKNSKVAMYGVIILFISFFVYIEKGIAHSFLISCANVALVNIGAYFFVKLTSKGSNNKKH